MFTKFYIKNCLGYKFLKNCQSTFFSYIKNCHSDKCFYNCHHNIHSIRIVAVTFFYNFFVRFFIKKYITVIKLFYSNKLNIKNLKKIVYIKMKNLKYILYTKFRIGPFF